MIKVSPRPEDKWTDLGESASLRDEAEKGRQRLEIAKRRQFTNLRLGENNQENCISPIVYKGS